MAEISLAQPAHQSTEQKSDLEHVSGIAERVLRGQELYSAHSVEFEHRHGAWFITSDTMPSQTYAVRLGPVETCECADHEHRGSRCKHIIAATMAQAKSRVCSCCGQRVLSRFTTEVQEEDELLSWFVGDIVCATCISEGFWA